MASDDNNNQESAFDTDRQYLGGVYARALMGMAEKSGQVDALMQELDSLVDTLDQLPRLRASLESPRIAAADKDRLIERAFGSRASKPFLNFLRVVTAKGRADCLAAIRTAARQWCDERDGRIRATMVTARPVEPAMEQKIAERLKQVFGKTVSVSAAVDPSLIGGLVVRVGDTVYDGSLKNQLNQVRAAAIGRTNQAIKESLERFASA